MSSKPDGIKRLFDAYFEAIYYLLCNDINHA